MVRLVDHAPHLGFKRDVGSNRKAAPALGGDPADGILGRGKIDVGDGDLRALPREQQTHRPAIADRVGRGVEGPLSSADNQNSAPPEPASAGSGARRFRTQRADVAFRLGIIRR